jgi:hypothetical protein
MNDDQLIARLAAVNPVPTGTQVREPQPLRFPRRTALAAALAAAAIGLPTVAFADEIGALFGFSNEGTPVPRSASPFTQDSSLNEAMQELGFPSRLHLLTERDGVRFYAARRENGAFCFAVDLDGRRAVGCSVTPAFPSPQRPIVDFSRFSKGARIVGFAADGVSTIGLVDASGATIATAPVIDNVYAATNTTPGAVGVEALDSQGAVVYTRAFHEAP